MSIKVIFSRHAQQRMSERLGVNVKLDTVYQLNSYKYVLTATSTKNDKNHLVYIYTGDKLRKHAIMLNCNEQNTFVVVTVVHYNNDNHYTAKVVRRAYDIHNGVYDRNNCFFDKKLNKMI